MLNLGLLCGGHGGRDPRRSSKREANPKVDYHSCTVSCAMQSHNAAANSLRMFTLRLIFTRMFFALLMYCGISSTFNLCGELGGH